MTTNFGSLCRIVAVSLVGSGLLIGCQAVPKPDEAKLISVSTAPRKTPDCAGCHAFPLNDVNHMYHLTGSSPRAVIKDLLLDARPSGVVTCMDCHFGSIAHTQVYDTIWGTAENIIEDIDAVRGTTPIFKIESIAPFFPVPNDLSFGAVNAEKVNALLDSAARIGKVISWLTGKDHMNGFIDVAISPSLLSAGAIVDSVYRPKDLSCSSIECHNTPKKRYRWGSFKKGLIPCPTINHTPEEDTSCQYMEDQENL